MLVNLPLLSGRANLACSGTYAFTNKVLETGVEPAWVSPTRSKRVVYS